MFDSDNVDERVSKIRLFFETIHDFLLLNQLPNSSGITTDGPDYLFIYDEEMHREAPATAELLTTGDFVDDMDGWRVWDEEHSKYDQTAYITAIRRDYDEALALYQRETGTTWQPLPIRAEHRPKIILRKGRPS